MPLNAKRPEERWCPARANHGWNHGRSRLAGHEFVTKSGLRFSYEATQRAIDLNNTHRMIPRSDFDKALERMPVTGPGELQDLQSPLYIYGILTDPRISQPGEPIRESRS